jgi:transcriptional regulator with XRE-family HTH domain
MPRNKLIKVKIKPEVIQWAIRTSGWEKSDIISKLRISASTYKKWLEGYITVKQLENLASKLKRPLAIFFLPKAPKEKPNPKDYRM